ncbi:uncharacterized protein LOC100890694 [Strongylocentrotus purpuratus]|uniref:Uncharacterized protein n=1 Tax=Strongylocentrotus purpuratus TaxID=7668 RepID=A0A7M7NEL7_STRPU|nr:uncharacterized protein LOC100890694 [Strongylocentrotus purpuratus]
MAEGGTGELMMGTDEERQVQVNLLLDLSLELGSSWKDIGRRLGLLEADLENIESDYPKQKERGYQMLLKWRQMTRNKDLVKTLVQGLQSVQRVDLADKYGPRFEALFPSEIESDAASPTALDAKETRMVEHLKYHYKKRNKVPMVPWAGKNGKIVTVDLGRVYTNLVLLVDIDSPDLPIHYRLAFKDLFKDVKAVDGNDNEIDGCEETLATSSTRVVARGRTGSGKTTFLLKLTSDWAEARTSPVKDAVAVFLLQLKKLDHTSNFGAAVVDQLLPKKDFTPQFIEQFAEKNQKRVAVLLDGYDEFKGKGLDQKNCGNIVKMLRKEYLPFVQILITTRPGRVGDFMKLEDHITDEYRHLQITGFSSEDIDAYVKKIFKRRPELGEKLLAYLEENHLKTELASLPLMCCAFCQLTKLTDGKDFKDMNTISSLFDKLVKCLLKYHPRSKEQRTRLRSWDSTEKDVTEETYVKSGDIMNENEDATGDAVFQSREVDEDDLILQLGKVALLGFVRSDEEELIFRLKDFEDCKSGAREVVAMGCKVGILVRDEEAEYRPTLYEDLEINNEDGVVDSHNITFVLKIIQEKLAGSYLAYLSTGNEEERCFFKKCVEDIRTLQRATDLGNVLMFASGANVEAARTIISHVVSLMKSEEENIKLFMNGKLHYTECQRVQKLIEFCLQLNFESQSKGELNDVLAPLMSGCSRLRLVGISSYVTKSLGYFLQHGRGISIKSLELIRLHLNSSSEFREFLNSFPGLENDVSDSLKRKRRRRKKQSEEPLTEEKRREKLREGVTKGREIPKYLLQRPDDTFLAVLPLWEQVNQMQMSEWNFGPVIDGLERCPVEELILNGVKANPADWERLFRMFSNSSFTSLKRLTLSMNNISDECLAKLVPGLSRQSNLTQLKLSGNEVGPDFLDALEECPMMENLEELVLEKTDMDSESIEQLGDLLKHFPSLSALDIRRNTSSDDTSIISILDGVQHCPQLDKLMISLHHVTEKALNQLQTKVGTLARLKELHLVHTPVPEKVIACAAGFLPVMPNLEDLRISGTPPDKTKPHDEGTARVSCEVADLFSNAVLATPSLRFLSILYTPFGPDSFVNLLEKSSEATKVGLKTLRFSKACIPEEEEVRRHVRNAEKTFLRIWV